MAISITEKDELTMKESNTWPKGHRHAMSQSEHNRWNARNYPGTRQMCSMCGQFTGRCEDDSLYADEEGPLCDECFGDKGDA